MPSTPYAKIRIRVNGGAPQTGRVEVSPGDTIQLEAESYDGWSAPVARWEWYSFPDGWTGPGGAWQSESVAQPDGSLATVYFWLGNSQPPSFAAPAINLWGKYLCRLIVNDGYKGGAPSSDVKDESTLMEIVSPNGLLRDVAWLEGSQAGQEKKWVRDFQNTLRKLDNAVPGFLTPYASTPEEVTDGTGSVGVSTDYALGDHSHQLTFATLNTIIGAASAAIGVNGQTVTSGGFVAPYFASNSAGVATTGLLRAPTSGNLINARDALNTTDIAVLRWGLSADDAIDIGEENAARVQLGVKTGGSVRVLENGAIGPQFSRTNGIVFANGAAFTLSQTTGAGAGADATFTAQGGAATFSGGKAVIEAGTTGAGGTASGVDLQVRTDANGSGLLRVLGGASVLTTISYASATTRTKLEIGPDDAIIDTKELGLDATNVALFATSGSYGGGSGVMHISDASTEPTTDVTNGIALYCGADALKTRNHALVVLAPDVESAPGAEDLRAPDRRASRLTTNDATQTTALTFAMPNNAVAFFDVVVVAKASADTTSAVYKIRAGVKRHGGGGATLIGAVDVFEREDNAALDATLDVNSNDVRIRVTGIGATTFNWFVTADATLMQAA